MPKPKQLKTMVRVCFTHDPDLDKDIREAAKAEHLSISDFMRKIVLSGYRDYLLEKQRGVNNGV